MTKFHNANRETEKGQRKVFVDIDETICSYDDPTDRRYNLAVPIQHNIEKVNKMYQEGWHVTYWTARGSVSKKDYTEYTRDQLLSWGCLFNDLITGTTDQYKPHFDLVIDDKAKRIEEL